jgi:hypothetical protein
MKNVFISYHHIEPDESLAQSIEKSLTSRRLKVFVDTKIFLGTKWVKEIEKQIRMADYFIVLLSKESIRSDMVRREVDLAYKMTRKAKNPLRILPIRVGFEGELPYDMGAYLGPIQYALWKVGESHEVICSQILAAIEQAVALPRKGEADPDSLSSSGIQELARATENMGAPLPAADPRLELDIGSVKLTSPFYVKRRADTEMEQYASLIGTTILVKGPEQIGKSSLLARAYAQAKRAQKKVCYADYHLIDDSCLSTLETLLLDLARKMARQFKTDITPDEHWKAYPGGTKDNFTSYFEEAILSKTDSSILLVLDEVDHVFGRPYMDDFFGLIRGWHNNRANDETWCRVNLIIAYSTEPYLSIPDLDRSPFYANHEIRLQDFDAHQISALNEMHGTPLQKSNIQKFIVLVGGHPYLVRQGLYALSINKWSMAELHQHAVEDTGPFGDHLRKRLWYLHDNEDLKLALKAVLAHASCPNEIIFQRLRAAGLVLGETRGQVRMRCQLYERYFKEHL